MTIKELLNTKLESPYGGTFGGLLVGLSLAVIVWLITLN